MGEVSYRKQALQVTWSTTFDAWTSNIRAQDPDARYVEYHYFIVTTHSNLAKLKDDFKKLLEKTS